VVGADGLPRDVRALDAPSPFSEAAVAAVRGQPFAPAERDGEAVAARIRLLIRFVDPGPAPEPAPLAAEQPPGASPASPAGGSPGASAASPAAPGEPAPLEVTVSGLRPNPPRRLTRAEVR